MNQGSILIIGGGIIGLFLARECATAGFRVTVLDRQEPGREASWAGGGILWPLYAWQQPDAIIPLFLWSRQVYPKISAMLHKATGIDPEWRQTGLILIERSDLRFADRWCKSHFMPCESITPDQALRLEPNLRLPGQRHLRWFPDVAQIRNPRLLKALCSDLISQKVRLLAHCRVLSLQRKGDRIAGIDTEQGILSADHIVIASGAWSGQIWSDPSPPLDVEPVKGQMLLFKAAPGLLRHIIVCDERYLIPRSDGYILAGSTLEQDAFNKSTTLHAQRLLQTFAYTTIPALKQYNIEKHWAGLRPGSPSGIPYIGRHPRILNLSFNCGHFRHGVTTEPASARLLADQILQRKSILAPEPYFLDAPR